MKGVLKPVIAYLEHKTITIHISILSILSGRELNRDMSISKEILITGSAGFIGFHLANRLLLEGYTVVGLDNLNNYYDVDLKKSRLSLLNEHKNFSFVRASLEDKTSIEKVFQ